MMKNLTDQEIVRREKVKELEDLGIKPFGHAYKPTSNSKKLQEKYLEKTKEELEEKKIKVKVAGRIMTKRRSGKAGFMHIQDKFGQVQIYIREDEIGEAQYYLYRRCDIGDIIGIEGFVIKTNTGELNAAIMKLKDHRESLSRLQESLKESGETQIAKTDQDCKKMRTGHQGIDMCYNVQISVDSKHKLIVAHDVTNDTNDLNQLAPMAEQSKEVLEVETLELTADKGYFNEEQIAECEGNDIKCYIPTPDNSHNKSKGLFLSLIHI